MTDHHQPKDLIVMAMDSFTSYMSSIASELIKKLDDELETTHKLLATCSKLLELYHNSTLPPIIANEMTNHLLKKLDAMYPTFEECFTEKWCQEIVMNLVELFMHPSVTVIKLGPAHLHAFGDVYCNFIGTAILKKVYKLHNLKTLHLQMISENYCVADEYNILVLPSQLKEFAVCGYRSLNDEDLNKVVESCKELTSLVTWDCNISEFSTPHITKCKHLEVLHVTGGSYMRERGYVVLLNAISSEKSSDKLSSSTIRSFGIRLEQESTLHLIVDKLPNLTEIVLSCSHDIDLSSLTQLKNLRSLSLSLEGCFHNSDQYKKILPDLGKQLVSLDLRQYYTLDLEFIGKTCSRLKCLHVDSITMSHPRPSLEIFPYFRTVECLQVKMPDDYDWTEFIIVQCLNINKLDVTMSYRDYDVLENVLKRTSLQHLEEIHWSPEIKTHDNFTNELCTKCPNLRIVHGLGSKNFTYGRVLFDLYGCQRNFCKPYEPPTDDEDSRKTEGSE